MKIKHIVSDDHIILGEDQNGHVKIWDLDSKCKLVYSGIHRNLSDCKALKMVKQQLLHILLDRNQYYIICYTINYGRLFLTGEEQISANSEKSSNGANRGNVLDFNYKISLAASQIGMDYVKKLSFYVSQFPAEDLISFYEDKMACYVLDKRALDIFVTRNGKKNQSIEVADQLELITCVQLSSEHVYAVALNMNDNVSPSIIIGWDLQHSNLIFVSPLKQSILRITYFSDSNSLLAYSDNAPLVDVCGKTGNIFSEFSDELACINFSTKHDFTVVNALVNEDHGTVYTSCGNCNGIAVFHLDGKLQFSVTPSQPCGRCGIPCAFYTISYQLDFIIGANCTAVSIWSVENGELLYDIPFPGLRAGCFKVITNGRFIISVLAENEEKYQHSEYTLMSLIDFTPTYKKAQRVSKSFFFCCRRQKKN